MFFTYKVIIADCIALYSLGDRKCYNNFLFANINKTAVNFYPNYCLSQSICLYMSCLPTVI